MNDLILRKQDLVENPTPRVAICLVLDVSGSMQGPPIAELNEGVQLFFRAILADETAQYAAEIAVVTFGNIARVELDFADIHKQTVPVFSASGSTPMAQAVNHALDLLENRKKEYSEAGVDYYQPWMVLMTDGEPTDQPQDVAAAGHRTSDLVEKKKLTIFPIGIGEKANMSVLATFSPKRAPAKLKGLDFKSFFEWLSKSVSRVSQSTPGENVKLPPAGWTDL